MVTITTAATGDIDAIVEFLAANKLPEAGLREHGTDLLVARQAARLVGTAALEVYGDSALLRSVAVDSATRGTGLGRALTQASLERAAIRGVRRVFLLTETAPGFFTKFGFTDVPRADVPASIRATVEFAAACPASARVMMLELDPRR